MAPGYQGLRDLAAGLAEAPPRSGWRAALNGAWERLARK